MIFAGIDEAGLGPVLGPLVVSASAFRIDADAPTDLWSRFSSVVTSSAAAARKRAHLVAVADSKTLYTPRNRRGLSLLERGVLSMHAASGAGPCETLGALLDGVSPGARKRAAGYPWYGPCDLEIPRDIGAADVKLLGNAVGSALRRDGSAMLALRSECLFAGEFNRMIQATQNKATTVMDVTCRLLAWVWNAWPDEPLFLLADRLGGRMHYREALQRLFPEASLKVVEETDVRSAYQLRDGRREAEIVFQSKAERVSLPTALASMLSKYLRELFMACFNGFWMKHVEDLAPTAGYYTDGRRFYGQISPVLESMAVPAEQIYRNR